MAKCVETITREQAEKELGFSITDKRHSSRWLDELLGAVLGGVVKFEVPDKRELFSLRQSVAYAKKRYGRIFATRYKNPFLYVFRLPDVGEQKECDDA